MSTIQAENAQQNVLLIMKAAGDWLQATIGDPNRSATSWRLGEFNIETHYSLGEGVLHLWTDGGWPGRRLVTRGRNDADLQLWMDTLEACKP